jgi:predicted RNA binding protein YcfA (HicA-like mRNA interferase family)
MKLSELVQKLRRGGFNLKRHGHKHDIYEKDGIEISVPRHAKELPTGTAFVILKEAGLK